MRRLVLETLLLFALAASASLWVLWTERRVNSDVDEQSLTVRLETSARLALKTAELQLQTELSQISSNVYLRAAAEELDDYAVAEAMQTFCEARKLGLCRAYDAEGAAFGESGEGLGKNDRKDTAKLGERETVARFATDSGHLRVLGYAAISGDGGVVGYVKLERDVTHSLRRELADVSGVTVELELAGRKDVHSGHGARMVAVELGSVVPGLRIKGILSGTTDPDAGKRQTSYALAAIWFFSGLAWCGLAWKTLSPLRRYELALREITAAPAVTDGKGLPVLAPFSGLGRALGSAVGALRSEAQAAHTKVADVERKLGRLADLLAIEDGAFRLFVETASDLRTLCETETKAMRQGPGNESHPRLLKILSHVDTLLSNARLFNLTRVQNVARECEDFLVKALADDRFDLSVTDVLTGHLHAIDREVQSYVDLRERVLGADTEGERLGQQLAVRSRWLTSLIGRIFNALKDPEGGPTQLGELFDEYQAALQATESEDLGSYVFLYNKMVREGAEKLGKSVGPVVLTGNCRFLPPDLMRRLNDVLMHCLRNAVEHGIEIPSQRRAAGKAAPGRIGVDCNVVGGVCTVVIRDDGRGLVPSELKAKAVGRGFLSTAEANALGDEAAFELPFRTGFSTAGVITDMSGRGVGLDIVRESVRQLGGDAHLRGAAGIGTEVHLHFPLRASRFEARLGLFNLRAELEALLRALAPVLSETKTLVKTVNAGASELVACDRLQFTALMKELLVAVNTYAVKPYALEIELENDRFDGGVNLGNVTITIKARRTSDSVFSCDASLLRIADSAIATKLLECGIMTSVDEQQNLILAMPSAATCLPPRAAIAILSLIDDDGSAAALIAEQGGGLYGSLELKTFRRGETDAFVKALSHARGIVVVDEEAFSGDSDIRRLVGQSVDVVIVAANPTALPIRSIYSVCVDPLIVGGVLDRAGAAQALEVAVHRLWVAWRGAAPTAPELGVAA